MAKARSPQYPAIGLKEAIEKVAAIYSKDYQNTTSREVVAKHMGYDSLHGKALSVLSALGKYGLLEGRGETRVSDLAVKVIAHQPGDPERVAALKEAASKPELFAEIGQRFSGGKASDTAIRSYLLTQRFIPSAADLAIRSYRETKELVEAEAGGYIGSEPDISAAPPMQSPMPPVAAKPGVERAEFPLPEGVVRLEFPASLSTASYEDFQSWVELVLRRAKRGVSDDDEAAN